MTNACVRYPATRVLPQEVQSYLITVEAAFRPFNEARRLRPASVSGKMAAYFSAVSHQASVSLLRLVF